MFRYVGDISDLAHDIIKNYCLNFNTALDGTLGNGKDTDFLSHIFKKVYAFDIQKQCIDNFKSDFNNDNVTLINDSHENIHKYIIESLDAGIFNLGFLPGGDKKITTTGDSTINAINSTLKLLKKGGILAISSYVGHEAGKIEYEMVKNFSLSLDNHNYGVMEHYFLNRSPLAPKLIIIEKNI